jgi:hypothetical protein
MQGGGQNGQDGQVQQQQQQQQQQWELPVLEYRLQQVVKVKVKVWCFSSS